MVKARIRMLGPLTRLAVGGSLLLMGGCGFVREGTPIDPGELAEEPGWVAVLHVPLVHQKDSTDCGAAAIQMVLGFWHLPATDERLAECCPRLPGEGIRARDLRDLARRQGLESYLVHGGWEDLKSELGAGHPVIVGLVKSGAGRALTHYEVIVAIHPEKEIVVTQDPSAGWRQYPWKGFCKEWESTGFLTLVFSREGSRPDRKRPGP